MSKAGNNHETYGEKLLGTLMLRPNYSSQSFNKTTKDTYKGFQAPCEIALLYFSTAKREMFK